MQSVSDPTNAKSYEYLLALKDNIRTLQTHLREIFDLDARHLLYTHRLWRLGEEKDDFIMYPLCVEE